MADVKPAENPPSEVKNEVHSKPRSSGGRRGRGQGQGQGQHQQQNETNDHDLGGRKKKPELEHYKPGAFGSRKPEDQDLEHDQDQAKNKGNKKKTEVSEISEKVGGISIEEKTGRNRNRKKPEQAHYVPKKSTSENEVKEENHNRKKKGKNGGKQRKEENKKGNVEESQRNGHVEESGTRPNKSNNNRRGNNGNNTGNNSNSGSHENENNLPPRLRQKEDGGRSDRGRNKGGGGKRSGNNSNRNTSPTKATNEDPQQGRNKRYQETRESSSPMVSSEARSPSPGHSNQQQPQNQRRDSASSRHNRRSYSPQHRNIVSPTHRGRGGRRGGQNSRRFDHYRDSRDTSDWRYDHEHRNNQGQGGQKSLPPRLQRARDNMNWSKDHDYQSSAWEGRGGGHRRQAVRDYEVDDTRVYDYEKEDDDDEQPPRISDWSLEMAEEDEQKSKEQQRSEPHRGGILRLPPDAMVSSNSNDWRAHPPPQQRDQQHQHHHQYSRGGGGGHQDHYNHFHENNPAWRGMEQQQQQQNSRPNERYLFDPRNPKKPIPASHRGGGVRFPLDPRFAQQGGPPPPRMAGYRPPFPQQQGGGNMPMPNVTNTSTAATDPKALAAEGGEATRILGTNELRLMAIVKSGGPEKLCQLWHADVFEARQNIMRTFKHLLQNDLVFCARSDVEFFVWKICFYNLVATLKTWLQGGTIPQSERQMVEENVIELLDEGLDFYTEMLETLDETYRIGLEQYYDVLNPRSTDTKIRCALVSAQKCLLCLGDLARYKEMIQNTSNYGKARQYYQKASHIDTRNAKPFNQLAILAWTAKRKFEAVYYHMRCLQTKAPVESSRQSLVEIFEDIRKRWDVSEKKRLEERAQRKKEADSERDRMHLIKGTRLRKEIWIRPDGGRRLHRTTSAQEGAPDSEEAELKEMSTTELNRRFNNAFLHLIGTLYTHINIDAFPMGCDLLQKEFRILLSRSPIPIDCKRLVQIMALNMFIIEHTKMKASSDKDYVSVSQNYALQLAFEMFGILVERCNDLLLSFIPATSLEASQSIFHDDDLPNLLSAVKVWCDWLMGNNDTWYPILCDEPFNELAKLATHLEKLKPIISPILKQCLNEDDYLSLNKRAEDYDMIKLDEDAVLCGFTPWTLGVNWSIYRRYAPRNVPTTLLQDARRLDAINFCIDFLEGLEPPVLKWSPPDNAHISLVENIGSTADRVNAKLTHMLSREQDILEESYSDDESRSSKEKESYDIDRSSKIGQLKIRKEELERRRKEEEESRKLQQQILSEHVSVTLEVCPKVIVPDTNCFVDYLPEIHRLATNSPFQLRVPIVVLKELDGLAKGAKGAKYASPEHAAMVAENARHALSFLKDRPHNTRCVTSRGTVLASLGVTTEDDYDADKNNDDLILDACKNLAMYREEIRGDMRVVYRDLVLLTDDRNLKLKAHITDIPVNKLSDFIHWAYST